MSDKLQITIVDAFAGTETVRDFTAEELKLKESALALALEAEAEKQAKADARTSALAKLAALGLTEEEIAAL